MTRDRRAGRWARISLFLAQALALHLLAWLAVDTWAPKTKKHLRPAQVPVFVFSEEKEPPPPDEEQEEDETPEDEPDPEFDGQIVELPPPEVEQRPEEADYLAEYDVTVPEETRTEQFEINPEVLAPEWSEEQKLQQQDVVDLGVEKPSTGATPGDVEPVVQEKGTRTVVPSPWAMTNKPGIADPVPSSHTEGVVKGAPQNDLLNEKLGDRVALNAVENLYAGYLNRIRRLVNFYWDQNIDNLPGGVVLAKAAYITEVEVILDGTGQLEVIEVTQQSGSEALDDCVVRAFRVAGPFPNPPEGLVKKDGRVYLPSMAFTVRPGMARMNYEGVDPRAGVQFPGLMKSPR